MKRIQLNLATTQYYDRKAVYPVMAAAVLLVLILSFLNIRFYTRYRGEVREIQERIFHLEKNDTVRKQAKQESLPAPSKKEVDTLREQTGFVNRLIAMDVFPWDRLLDELESCAPPNILILRFATTKETDRIRIEGKAGSMKEITEFLRALDRSSLYRNSALLNVTNAKEAGRTAASNRAPAIRFEIETVVAVEPNAAGLRENPPKSPFAKGDFQSFNSSPLSEKGVGGDFTRKG